MRWCIVLAMFVLTSCGGSSSRKSAPGRVSDQASNTSSNGASAQFVTINVELYDNSELANLVPDVTSKMNAYQLSFVAKDADCDEGDQVITGDLNQNVSVEVDITRNCSFDVYLSYGWAPDAAGAAPNPNTGNTGGGPVVAADDAGVDDAGADDAGGAALVTYLGVGGAKEYLDASCALAGCHVTGATFPDLSTYAAITGEATSITGSIDRMSRANGVGIMPIGGTAAANVDAVALLQGWVDSQYAEGAAALALTNVNYQTTYYESEPIALTRSILDTHDLLTLKFKLCRTTAGESAGFTDASVECIQGGSYQRGGTGGGTTPSTNGGGNGNGGGDDGAAAADDGGADGGNADGNADGGNGNEIVGDPNSTLTFDDVQDLFITNPAAVVEGCTAANCHGTVKGAGATSDYSTYENVKAAEEANPGTIMLYVSRDIMPKTTAYGAEDKQKIADWIASGMAPGAVAEPDPNAVITSQVVALFAADKGNCSAAGCHGGAIAPSLIGADLKLNAAAALDRLDRYAAGMAAPMPQVGTGIDLTPEEVEMVRTWIDTGMPDVAPPAAAQ